MTIGSSPEPPEYVPEAPKAPVPPAAYRWYDYGAPGAFVRWYRRQSNGVHAIVWMAPIVLVGGVIALGALTMPKTGTSSQAVDGNVQAWNDAQARLSGKAADFTRAQDAGQTAQENQILSSILSDCRGLGALRSTGSAAETKVRALCTVLGQPIP